MSVAADSDTGTVRRSDSGTYSRDRRAVLTWALSAVAAAAVGAIGYAHGKLWDHDGALRVLERQDTGQEKRLDAMDAKLDRILDRLGAPAKP